MLGRRVVRASMWMQSRRAMQILPGLVLRGITRPPGLDPRFIDDPCLSKVSPQNHWALRRFKVPNMDSIDRAHLWCRWLRGRVCSHWYWYKVKKLLWNWWISPFIPVSVGIGSGLSPSMGEWVPFLTGVVIGWCVINRGVSWHMYAMEMPPVQLVRDVQGRAG